MKKDRYKSQQEDETNAGYIDEESGNYTEDNLEDDAEEEGRECEHLTDVPFIFVQNLVLWKWRMLTVVLETLEK